LPHSFHRERTILVLDREPTIVAIQSEGITELSPPELAAAVLFLQTLFVAVNSVSE
jgi:hypothetical protein